MEGKKGKGPVAKPKSNKGDGKKKTPIPVSIENPPGTPPVKVKDVGPGSTGRASTGGTGRSSRISGDILGIPPRTVNPGVTNQPNLGKATTDEQTKLLGMLGMPNLSLVKDSFNLVEKIFGRSQAVLEAISQYGSAFYDPLQKAMGGIQDISNISNETSKAQFDALNSIYDVYYENLEGIALAQNHFMVETATAASTNVNALFAYFKEPEEITRSYGRVVSNLKEEQILRLNELSEAEKVYLGTFEKGFNVSSNKIAKVMQRNIALTGEASVDIFGEISNFSSAVAEKTGVDYKQISGITMDIITDVQRFGNVQVEEAARIAGALTELGISYQTFGGMVDRFMNFDSAASSLGNLTTLFGVHFDAMEMMMLANEDQEEFLYRIREAFLETGKSIEDMTLAEKKLAASELGMDVTAFENFMRAERDITDTTAATREASEKGMKEGFETMTQNMVLVNRNMGEMEKYMQGKLLNPLKESAYQTHIELAQVDSDMKGIIDKSQAFEKTRVALRASAEGSMVGDQGIRKDISELIRQDYTQGRIEGMTDDRKLALESYMDELNRGTRQYTDIDFVRQLKKAGFSQIEATKIMSGYRVSETTVSSAYEKAEKESLLDKVGQQRRVNVNFEKYQDAQMANVGAESFSTDAFATQNITARKAGEILKVLRDEEQKSKSEMTDLQKEQYDAMQKFYEAIIAKGGIEKGEPVKLFFTNAAGELIKKELSSGSEINLGTGFRLQGAADR